ncbi:substrate-binding periplasmic protein [Thalassotalea sediminis]|uniref:substrate-binding periplasmic protein n=1 Tax=Thalassotalea sediminis TaxID=1759089 RepID=UPI0025746C1F|nr:transporter substrate-binding domain-containing protein [Thalassotalea sediminis]
MGYRTNAKLPYIEKSPSNNGIYQNLYKKALANINCKLKIIRAPKKRILFLLKQGEIDFYPGLGFNSKRAEYLHFIENGLVYRSATISRKNTATLSSFKGMQGHTVLMAQGANYDNKNYQNVTLRFVYDLSLKKAIDLISIGQADFYSYSADVIQYHLKTHPNDDIKVHYCCNKIHPMYLGFSVHSKYLVLDKNEKFDANSSLTVNNQKKKISRESIAFRFMQQLKQLAENGDVHEMVQQYSSVHVKS